MKAQQEEMREKAFQILTALLTHGATPTDKEQRKIKELRQNNPYFDKLMLETEFPANTSDKNKANAAESTTGTPQVNVNIRFKQKI